ncbi:DASS family sodium-coupled anion symporter [candidate division KSB1 bacterium]|nr:DASS family sodium-coupled anion symporter [candidate division KSB1 bacterium]
MNPADKPALFSVSSSAASTIPGQNFDRRRRTVSLFLGPVVCVIIWLIPLPALTTAGHRLTAIVSWILIYWIGEALPIPVTALLGPVLCVMAGIASPSEVFAPFANPIIFLFLGSFLLAQGMIEQRLDQRIALNLLSLRWMGNSPARLMLIVAGIPILLSMWISDSATTAMIYPILLGIIATITNLTRTASGAAIPTQFNTGLLLTIAYAALIGGIGTPVGTPPNLIGLGMLNKLAHIKIYFFQWMLLAIPIMCVMWTIMLLVMRKFFPPGVKDFPGLTAFLVAQKQKQGRWTRGQKNTLIAFLVAVVLWIFPGIVASGWGTQNAVFAFCERHLPEGVASLVAAMLLFLLPVNWSRREFTLSWAQATKIDWGTMLLFGGGLSLGSMFFSTGLAQHLGDTLIQSGGTTSLWGLTAIAIFLAILLTEMTSNTATANMLVPIMIAVAKSAGISPIPPTIAVCLGASMAFMLPVSTPSNAIIYGSGQVPITAMIRVGFVLDLCCGVVTFLGLRILCPWLGLV